ncbi:MAG: DUF362 domain-containing protein [Bacteroidetes bacterium]|nr:DUF362 domain-containing protein [Bacteroidota bacterium]
MKRRKFIQNVAIGGVGLVVGCSADSNPSGSTLPDVDPPDPAITKSKIALVKTSNRSEGVSRLMQMFEFESPENMDVILKPNFNTSDPPPASTHTDTLRQIITELNNRNASSIELCERTYQNFDEVINEKQVRLVTDEFGIRITNLDGSDCTRYASNAASWPNGFLFPSKIMDSNYIVTTCCLKTHFIGQITISLKLGVGLLPASMMQTMHSSTNINSMIAEINTAYQPKLIIVDGVTTFIEGGPSQGTTAEGNVMLAGTDRLALDIIGSAILKDLGSQSLSGPIMNIQQIRRARELNLGKSNLDEIEFITDDEISSSYSNRLSEIIALG